MLSKNYVQGKILTLRENNQNWKNRISKYKINKFYNEDSNRTDENKLIRSPDHTVDENNNNLWESLNSFITKNINLVDLTTFIMNPLPRNKTLNCKIVMKYDNSVDKMFPKYLLYIYNNDKFLLSAKKVFKSTSSTYKIYNDEYNMNNKSTAYLGKVSSNFINTQFNIYDNGKKPGNNNSDKDLRLNYGTIIYVRYV
jgi:hypothetical protein